MWGEDAHLFNPDRWLGSSKTKRNTAVGVYSNLCVFPHHKYVSVPPRNRRGGIDLDAYDMYRLC